MTPLDIDLNDLYFFTLVVQRQGFTAAARTLGVPKSRISRRIKLLEERLDTRLLQRNSRQLSLTDAGEVLYRHCQVMLSEALAGEAAVRERQQEPSGLVRLSVPVAIADSVLPNLLPAFLRRYPKVKISLQATNRHVDLLEEGVDVVIRGVTFEQESSSLVQVPLCIVRWGILAAPNFLADQTIDQPSQLAGINALLFSSLERQADMFRVRHINGASEDISVNVLLRSDNLQTLKKAALEGLGVVGLPLYTCSSELIEGSLKLLLPEWRPRHGKLVMLYPARRGLSPAVRALVDFVKTNLPKLVGAFET